MIDWSLIARTLPEYMEGLRVSMLLLAISCLTAFVLAIPLAMARVSRHWWLWGPVWLFTYVIRGTPLLVQLFMVYFGLAQFEFVRESAVWPLLKSAWFCAWLTFAINSTAYTTEIFAGALKNTPSGEIEAARSLGLSSLQIFRRILWPSAMRRALPQYGNEIVMMMHATAIASTVTLVELTRVARDVYYNYLAPVEAFGVVAVFYFTLTYAFVGLFKLIERRYLRHLAPRDTDVRGRGAPA